MNIPAWSVLSALLLELTESSTKRNCVAAKLASIGKSVTSLTFQDWLAYFRRINEVCDYDGWREALRVCCARYPHEVQVIAEAAECAISSHPCTGVPPKR